MEEQSGRMGIVILDKCTDLCSANTLTNLLGGSFFQVRKKIVPHTFLHEGPNES